LKGDQDFQDSFLESQALSIVIFSWIDSLNGPPGVVLAIAKGVLRCVLMNLDLNFEVIPVDLAINGMIVSTKHVALSKQK
jgi:Male sterility protein